MHEFWFQSDWHQFFFSRVILSKCVCSCVRVCACVRALRVRACERACVRACVCVCVRVCVCVLASSLEWMTFLYWEKSIVVCLLCQLTPLCVHSFMHPTGDFEKSSLTWFAAWRTHSNDEKVNTIMTWLIKKKISSQLSCLWQTHTRHVNKRKTGRRQPQYATRAWAICFRLQMYFLLQSLSPLLFATVLDSAVFCAKLLVEPAVCLILFSLSWCP